MDQEIVSKVIGPENYLRQILGARIKFIQRAAFLFTIIFFVGYLSRLPSSRQNYWKLAMWLFSTCRW